jgi:hypothetical protein
MLRTAIQIQLRRKSWLKPWQHWETWSVSQDFTWSYIGQNKADARLAVVPKRSNRNNYPWAESLTSQDNDIDCFYGSDPCEAVFFRSQNRPMVGAPAHTNTQCEGHRCMGPIPLRAYEQIWQVSEQKQCAPRVSTTTQATRFSGSSGPLCKSTLQLSLSLEMFPGIKELISDIVLIPDECVTTLNGVP